MCAHAKLPTLAGNVSRTPFNSRAFLKSLYIGIARGIVTARNGIIPKVSCPTHLLNIRKAIPTAKMEPAAPPKGMQNGIRILLGSQENVMLRREPTIAPAVLQNWLNTTTIIYARIVFIFVSFYMRRQQKRPLPNNPENYTCHKSTNPRPKVNILLWLKFLPQHAVPQVIHPAAVLECHLAHPALVGKSHFLQQPGYKVKTPWRS